MKLFKGYSEKEVKRVMPIVQKINSFEDVISELTDEELKAKTEYFKELLADGQTLDDILPEAFAVVREASKRVTGLRHFDVQLIGGIILHQGRIAEMRTGEGKTLVATLPAYLNALTGKGVHVITVNDYLAKRDSEWMGKIYTFLGLTVGLVIADMKPNEKQKAYNCDITYGTNNEFGFDYLRDNMVIYKDQLVQRPLNYAIVDEIDSILIDEARTPLIISGRANQASDIYKKADRFVSKLEARTIIEEDVKDEEQAAENEKYDYVVDLKAKSASLTAKGIAKAEKEFGLENLNDLNNSELVHAINQALRAHGIMKKDVDYIVKSGEVLIVDEFTGRIMYGRRYNNGLHQAIEAKEHVKVADESKTLANITFQNYFRMYEKLSGMTGTAMTEEQEFEEIYKLDVIEIPTNKPIQRKDLPDIIYKNETGKFNAVIEDIKKSYEKGQPVLVGTVSIDKSERLSKLLDKAKIPHQVLNAKYHEKEAEIIAQAGKYKAVTIATNMAGRGTDIILGGNSEYLAKTDMRKKYTFEEIEEATAFNETDDEKILARREEFRNLVRNYDKGIEDERAKVIEAGGLKIIGTERHESRRIDNQLRGRAGRQGDPGESRFYISLDDDLMKIFGGSIITKVYNKIGVSDDMPIESRILTRTVESSQKKVEGRNFSIRKNVLQYDDVMNKQRVIIYKQRREVLDGDNLTEEIGNMIDSVVNTIVPQYITNDSKDIEGLKKEIYTEFGIESLDILKQEKFEAEDVIKELSEKAHNIYNAKSEKFGESMRELERVVTLKIVDEKWMEHIDNMDELKNGVGLRAYAQKDPVVVYRMEGFDMFDEMVYDIQYDVVKLLMHVTERDEGAKRQQTSEITSAKLQETSAIELVDGKISPKEGGIDKTIRNEEPKVGRNDPCPCGSGKKYKNCCGRNQ
ncbi:MAG: preprotein translocase subunit SecA [Clostridiales bacterium]|mgnify:FL=1|nr:preprotein translocase subunit SecA [Clostridiales bacterium]